MSRWSAGPSLKNSSTRISPGLRLNNRTSAMPTIISHPAVPISLACLAGRKHAPLLLLAAGIAGSVLPDADVLGLRLGIPYADLFGHRGFSHSFVFAFLIASLGAAAHRQLKARATIAFAFLFLSIASHGFLDAATDGGLGVAFFSPFSDHRYFFDWRPIAVSPLATSRIFSSRLATVLASEFKWVWLPFLSIACVGLIFRKFAGTRWLGP